MQKSVGGIELAENLHRLYKKCASSTEKCWALQKISERTRERNTAKRENSRNSPEAIRLVFIKSSSL
jgi:hypothetical protein